MRCDKCILPSNIKHPCMLGRGCKINAKIMFIQDVPDENDDINGKVFSGKANISFSMLLEHRGFDMSKLYFTSMVKCAVPDPSANNLKFCKEYLEDEIETVNPDIIVPMGNHSLKFCVGTVGITKMHGNAQEVEMFGRTRIILPMMNPKLAEIKPLYKGYIRKDLNTLQELCTNGMTQVTGVNYKYLETIEDISKELLRLKKEAKELVFDIETTGKSPYMDYSKIVCISLTDKDHYGVVIPLYKQDSPLSTPEIGYIVKLLRNLLEDETIAKCAHNGKFDVEWLKEWLNINVANFNFDTMLAHYLCISEEKGTQGLKSQAWEFTDMGGYDNELDDYIKNLSDGEGVAARHNYDRVPWSILKAYAAADADCCFRLMKLYQPKIYSNPKWAIVMDKILMPGSYALEEVEANGMKIDMNTAQRYIDSYDMEIRRIKAQLETFPEVLEIEREKRELYKERERIMAIPKKDRTAEEQKKADTLKKYQDFKFNWNSVAHLKELLYDKMKLVTSVRTDKGELSTNETAMKELAEQGEVIPNLLLELRKVDTLNNMFIKKLPSMRDGNDIVHSSFNLVGCITGDSLIPTSQGLKRLQDLIEGRQDGNFIEKIMQIVNRNGQLENTSHVVYYSNRPTIRISTYLGLSIEGTYNHPLLVNALSRKDITYPNGISRYKQRKKVFLTENQVWRQLQDIHKDDFVAIPYGYNVYGNRILQIPSWEMHQHANAKKIKIPAQLTPELAELLGMWYADGSVKSSNGSWVLSICNSDPDVIDRVSYLSKELFDIEPTVYADSSTRYTDICSINLAPLESILQLQRGCLNKTIPQYILDAPKEIQVAYLKGMTLDGHYCANRYKHFFRYCFARLDTARTVQLMLLNMGILSSYRQDKCTDNSYYVTVYNQEYLKFRDMIGFVQSKKADYSYNQNGVKSPNYIVNTDHKIAWLKVLEIQEGNADVYDFTVPNTHSFISNGFISHNTITGRISSENPMH